MFITKEECSLFSLTSAGIIYLKLNEQDSDYYFGNKFSINKEFLTPELQTSPLFRRKKTVFNVVTLFNYKIAQLSCLDIYSKFIVNKFYLYAPLFVLQRVNRFKNYDWRYLGKESILNYCNNNDTEELELKNCREQFYLRMKELNLMVRKNNECDDINKED